MNEKHWLIFTRAHEVAGCHCGFRADIDADSGFGDSVVLHLMAEAWEAGKMAAYNAERDGRDGSEIVSPYHAALAAEVGR